FLPALIPRSQSTSPPRNQQPKGSFKILPAESTLSATISKGKPEALLALLVRCGETRIALQRSTDKRISIGQFPAPDRIRYAIPSQSPWRAQVGPFRGSLRAEHERALLGTMPDAEVAAQLGRSIHTVRIYRLSLGIPNIRVPSADEWTSEQEALLGTAPD